MFTHGQKCTMQVVCLEKYVFIFCKILTMQNPFKTTQQGTIGNMCSVYYLCQLNSAEWLF